MRFFASWRLLHLCVLFFITVLWSDPLCILMRGLPGSGKSTLAREFQGQYEDAHIVSTDEEFVVDGKYVFDRSRLREAHEAAQGKARALFERGAGCVIVDNCNLSFNAMEPYIRAALEHGYEIVFAETETPWKDSLEECMQRTLHGVPLEDMEAMQGRWESQEKVAEALFLFKK